MTATGVIAAQRITSAFFDAHFPWLPKPQIVEYDNIAGGGADYATATTLSVPKYSDVWNDGRLDILIHECGHVLAFWFGAKGYPILEQFLIAFGAPASLIHHPLINEIFAEHFARAYVDGYRGLNQPVLVGLVPFDAAKMRAFCEALRPPAPVNPLPGGSALNIIPLPSPNFSPRTRAIQYIVLHTTQGTDSRAWLTSAASQVSAHYLVRGLDVYRLVDEDNAAWHAGIIVGIPTTPLYTPGVNPNDESIGIEMEGFAAQMLDAATLDTTAELIADIEKRRGYLPLVSHSELSPGNRTDPGAQNRVAVEERLGDDMFTQADRDLLARVKDLLEAREPLVWAAREQRGLDVETGKPYDATKPPQDPRVKT